MLVVAICFEEIAIPPLSLLSWDYYMCLYMLIKMSFLFIYCDLLSYFTNKKNNFLLSDFSYT